MVVLMKTVGGGKNGPCSTFTTGRKRVSPHERYVKNSEDIKNHGQVNGGCIINYNKVLLTETK
jgi:hypothetical protein